VPFAVIEADPSKFSNCALMLAVPLGRIFNDDALSEIEHAAGAGVGVGLGDGEGFGVGVGEGDGEGEGEGDGDGEGEGLGVGVGVGVGVGAAATTGSKNSPLITALPPAVRVRLILTRPRTFQTRYLPPANDERLRLSSSTFVAASTMSIVCARVVVSQSNA